MTFEASVLILIAAVFVASLVAMSIAGPKLRTAVHRADAVWLDLFQHLAQERADFEGDRVQRGEGRDIDKRPISRVETTIH